MYVLRAVYNPDKILNEHILRAQAWLANDRALSLSLSLYPTPLFQAHFSTECTKVAQIIEYPCTYTHTFRASGEKRVFELNWVFLWWATSSLYHLIISATTKTKIYALKIFIGLWFFLCVRYKRAHFRSADICWSQRFPSLLLLLLLLLFIISTCSSLTQTMDHPPVKSSLCDARNIINLLGFAMKRDNKAHEHTRIYCYAIKSE